MANYRVIIGCENDATGKRFEPGDTVTDDDFSANVIAEWVTQGVLAAPEGISTEMPAAEQPEAVQASIPKGERKKKQPALQASDIEGEG